jgi:hypothetical protein
MTVTVMGDFLRIFGLSHPGPPAHVRTFANATKRLNSELDRVEKKKDVFADMVDDMVKVAAKKRRSSRAK